ncbi:uncharacterized protein LOC141528107 [Cotesia typhae]|uniref:uncharacterized protein LOC141528107 n=1 Tax=Cotesia typhae TaxID=2053667 RepID=UPI003D699A14
MNRRRLLESFTQNCMIDSWSKDEENIEFRGFIDTFVSMETLTAGNARTQLLTVIASNGSDSQVRINFWAAQAINFNAQLYNRAIITISKGRCERAIAIPNHVHGLLNKHLRVCNHSVVRIGPGTFN